jgi:hypothetical protein
VYGIAAKTEIVVRLESLLPAKNGAAKDVTALAIKSREEEIARATRDGGCKGHSQ